MGYLAREVESRQVGVGGEKSTAGRKSTAGGRGLRAHPQLGSVRGAPRAGMLGG